MKHILLALLLTLPAAAQTAPPDAPTPQNQTDHTAQADRELKHEEQQRMLGIVPEFSAVLNGTAAALNPRQKFKLFIADAFDPFDFATTAVDAGLEQHSNEYPEYGSGITGYSKRYAASFADDVDGGLFSEAILPSVLHQDPRYFRLGHGGFLRRVGYTALFVVRCRGDNGRWQPNYSSLGGNLIAGAVSNAYYPAADRGFGLTLDRGFTVIAENALGNGAVEFYPDVISFLKRRVHHHHPTQP